MVLAVNNMPANAGDTRDVGSVPGLGRFPGGGNGNSSILAWKIPWAQEPGGLQSLVSQSWTRLRRLSTHSTFMFIQRIVIMPWKALSHIRLFATPWTVTPPGQNTGVGSLSLLQGIFLNKESNPGPPHCRRILYQLSLQGSPINQYIYITIYIFYIYI